LLVSTIISAVGIALAIIWPEYKRCEAYFIMLYLRAGFYVLTLLFDCIVKHYHTKLRLDGYHDFHREMKDHHTIPLKVVSLWNSAILAMAAGLHHYYGEHFTETCIRSYFSPVVYLTSFNIAETIIFFFVHGTYMAKVVRFNNLQLAPDALRGSSISTSGALGLIHSQSEGMNAFFSSKLVIILIYSFFLSFPLLNMNHRVVNELLEKQSDMIEYLRDHCNRLNQKLQQMSNQLRTVTLSPHPSI
jgi:hypothetical protein